LRSPGGRHLDRDARLGDPLHGAVVEAAQVALGARALRPPDLDEVRVGEDVEQAAARGLAEPLEVRAPHLVGRRRGVPDVVAVVVDGVLAEEVDRADHVVPGAVLEQRGHAVLAAGDEVGLDPEPEVGLLAHEGAVRVEIVAREALPQRVAPDVERRREAVDVLADAELGDPALGRDGAVVLGVGGGEVALRPGLELVRAQVDVVVGQHVRLTLRGARVPGREQQLGHAQVDRRRDLQVLARRLDELHDAAGRLDQRGVVGRPGEHVVGLREHGLERGAAEDLRRLDRPQAAAVEGPGDDAVLPGLLRRCP
jgi:hypothetical protein